MSLLFARNPIDTGFREIGQTDREINRKGVMQVIRVTARILLLPWIQWVTIQVIESYETNGFFSVQISWITSYMLDQTVKCHLTTVLAAFNSKQFL